MNEVLAIVLCGIAAFSGAFLGSLLGLQVGTQKALEMLKAEFRDQIDLTSKVNKFFQKK